MAMVAHVVLVLLLLTRCRATSVNDSHTSAEQNVDNHHHHQQQPQQQSSTSQPAPTPLVLYPSPSPDVPLPPDADVVVANKRDDVMNVAMAAQGSPAPRYMMELYDQYTHSDEVKPANTVRNIYPVIDAISSSGIFTFHLSCVQSTEVLVKAELHLYKRKQRKKKHRDKRSLTLKTFTPSHVMLEKYRMAAHYSKGWQVYDVTTSISIILSRRATNSKDSNLLVDFYKSRNSTSEGVHRLSRRPMNPRAVSRFFSTVALVVFSNDTQNITLDHLDPHVGQTEAEELEIIDPATGLPLDMSGYASGHKRRGAGAGQGLNDGERGVSDKVNSISGSGHVGDLQEQQQELIWGDFNAAASGSRDKRSIFDNHIPQHSYQSVIPVDYRPEEVAIPHPSILITKSDIKHEKAFDSVNRKKHNKGKLIPYPEGYHKKDRRGRKHRQRAIRERSTREEASGGDGDVFLDNWNEVPRLGPDGYPEEPAECSRRQFTVDFADIGWSDWIIAPDSFNIHYCQGSCAYPLAKSLFATNHATLQSLIHAVGIHHHVPSPCCVPDSYSSLTLLYFDIKQNVVIKNYPKMTVQSCSCR